MFIFLERYGYNTVRTLLNPFSIVDSLGNLNSGSMDNIADFLERAEMHGIGIIFTIQWAPLNVFPETISEPDDLAEAQNAHYLFSSGYVRESHFWKEFIRALKLRSAPMDAIFAYGIRNEIHFDVTASPLNQTITPVVCCNGTSYDLSVSGNMQKLIDDSFTAWSSAVRTAILAEEPEALVTAGFYLIYPGSPGIRMPSMDAIFSSELDFIDLHMYPDLDPQVTVDSVAKFFTLDQNRFKPVLMGEFGFMDNDNRSLDTLGSELLTWKNHMMSYYEVDGWILWTWDNGEGLSKQDEGLFLKRMANQP
ncbi:hypothetical protein GCM10011369_05590 [Neiella marina]|uniref:Glycoside hydrolase family 5 domain-containing protein n=2 Tax=Neiella marina TaxID=508461 RepID=A0A8J2XMT7_9GAMM|nr:hypothetical protein GCM10011369_05590 [Neiella marina]